MNFSRIITSWYEMPKQHFFHLSLRSQHNMFDDTANNNRSFSSQSHIWNTLSDDKHHKPFKPHLFVHDLLTRSTVLHHLLLTPSNTPQDLEVSTVPLLHKYFVRPYYMSFAIQARFFWPHSFSHEYHLMIYLTAQLKQLNVLYKASSFILQEKNINQQMYRMPKAYGTGDLHSGLIVRFIKLVSEAGTSLAKMTNVNKETIKYIVVRLGKYSPLARLVFINNSLPSSSLAIQVQTATTPPQSQPPRLRFSHLPGFTPLPRFSLW